MRVFGGMQHGMWKVSDFTAPFSEVRQRSMLPARAIVDWVREVTTP